MRALKLAIASVFVLSGSVAFAQDDAKREAEKRFEEGKTFFNQRKYSEARNRFLEACAVLKTETCSKNLGVVESELGMYAEAAAHFRDYLDDPRAKADPVRSEIENEFTTAKAHVCELEIVAPGGSAVHVDERAVGIAPVHAIFIAPGLHRVTATWGEGAGANASQDVTATLGHVRVELRDQTSGSGSPSTTRRPLVGWLVPAVMVGVGAVGLGVGVGLALDSQGKHDAAVSAGNACAAPSSAACSDLKSTKSDGEASATASIVSYVVGSVLAAAGVAAFILWPSERVELRPQVGLVQGAELLVRF